MKCSRNAGDFSKLREERLPGARGDARRASRGRDGDGSVRENLEIENLEIDRVLA